MLNPVSMNGVRHLRACPLRQATQLDSSQRRSTQQVNDNGTQHHLCYYCFVVPWLQEKLELSRGLAQQTRLNADLAQENEALASRLNEQGKAMDALEKKVWIGQG
jgi:hypothetical protein